MNRALLAILRYGDFIPVMTRDEQAALADGSLCPSVIQICAWCERLQRRNLDIEKRFSEALGKPSTPPNHRK